MWHHDQGIDVNVQEHLTPFVGKPVRLTSGHADPQLGHHLSVRQGYGPYLCRDAGASEAFLIEPIQRSKLKPNGLARLPTNRVRLRSPRTGTALCVRQGPDGAYSLGHDPVEAAGKGAEWLCEPAARGGGAFTFRSGFATLPLRLGLVDGVVGLHTSEFVEWTLTVVEPSAPEAQQVRPLPSDALEGGPMAQPLSL